MYGTVIKQLTVSLKKKLCVKCSLRLNVPGNDYLQKYKNKCAKYFFFSAESFPVHHWILANPHYL